MPHPSPQALAALAAEAETEVTEILETKPLIKWWYESLADYMIANPTASLAELSAHFGKAQTTISIIRNTDAFKAYFRQRRDQHADKLDLAVRNKMFKVAESALDHLLTSLDKRRDTIPIDSLHRTVDTTLKNLGYGASAPSPAVSVNVNSQPASVNVAVSLEDIEKARAALRRNQQAPMIEHNPEEPSEAALAAAASLTNGPE